MFLRRFSRSSLLSTAQKESTGVVGLPVVADARAVLIELYRETLRAVQAVPAEAEYRRSVERLTAFRLKACEEARDAADVEARVACGQVEELICQARDELELIPKMAEWKPWEVPEGHKVELEVLEDLVPKHVPSHFKG